jgi:hypothetical protein
MTVVTTAALLLGVPPAVAAHAVAARPAVTGPVTGGNGAVVLQATAFDLGKVGYTQSEFFLSGSASSYAPAAALGADGRWQVTPASSAPYTTRIVVNRPADPARFNGSVIVEWLNVSAGLDVAPDWVVAHNELVRDGFAWVGASAQAVGVAADRAADPQPDFPGFRLWEMAGTAHADDYIANLGAADDGTGTTASQELTSMLNPPAGTPGFTCGAPINTGQLHYVLDTAQYALNRWVTTRTPPPTASRLQVTAAGFVLDANGNAEGGVRTPSVDAPVATLSGRRPADGVELVAAAARSSVGG